MKISYIWLKSLLDINKEPQEIAHLLTQAGLEVTSITPFHFIPQELIVGKIITCTPHPNADKLFVTKVDIGQEKPLIIVCGAPNVAANQKVVVAPIGTQLTLPNNKTLKIKKVTIRGQASEGMLCAEDEIGLSNHHHTIITLNTKYRPGIPLTKVWNTPLDTIFDIDLTPNRNDATHHIGVARDLAAKIGIPLQRPIIPPLIPSDSLPIHVTIKDKPATPRYCGIVIKNIQIKPSPIWMQRCLKSIGVRPINNIVDITNFIMHDIGQPLHAFDYDKIHKRKIKIQKLPKGTPFTALDGTTHTLNGQELMICDTQQPLAMAGIIGSKHARITPHTHTIFLESAHFDPITIYKASKYHKIHTNAAMQNARGTDPYAPYKVLQKAVSMFQKYANGTIASMVIDEIAQKPTPKFIPIQYTYINRIAGIQIPPKTIHSILTSLDITTKQNTDIGFIAIVQPYRRDVNRPADIVEEILRIYGYQKLTRNPQTTPFIPLPQQAPPATHQTIKLKNHLVAQGYTEIITNSLTNSQYPQHKHPPIKLANPLSQPLDSLRTTLLFTGLEIIRHNLNRGQQTIKLFEIGHIYLHKETYQQQQRLALWIAGHNQPISWAHQQQQVQLLHIQKTLKNLCDHIGIPYTPKQETHTHYKTCLTLHHKHKTYAHLGQISKHILDQLGIHTNVFFAEIDTTIIQQHSPLYQEPSKYPSVTRDLSLALPTQTPFPQVQKTIQSLKTPLLKNLTLIDYYQGQNLKKNQKSYTIRLTLQSNHKTLTPKEIDTLMQRIETLCQEKLHATIRQ